MKRVISLVLCLMLVIPFAAADTADTLPKRFARQLTGGNGIRGYMSITASGLADWLSALLPFTATDIQIRAIGEKQGEMSENILDDDDWQVKFYAENSAKEQVGTTWLYGNPEGVFFQSELLPETVLTVPVEKTHLLYELFRGEWTDLFFAFDTMELKASGANGNPAAYESMAKLFGIPADEWEADWLPVLEKYFTQLDLWLAGFGDPSFAKGEEAGSLKMSATYNIPAEELKKEAKYLVGQMVFDHDLQNLLLPYVTDEIRATYLNQSLVYVYEACIDAMDLQGDVVLSREMSALGDVVSTTVSLPVPELPAKMTEAAGEAAAAIFGLENKAIFDGVDRMVMTKSGAESSLTISSDKRTITISANENAIDEHAKEWNGSVKIIPNAGVDENALSALYSFAAGHKIWQDEKYLDHDTTELNIAFEPDLENLDEDDPFRNSYIEIQPVSLDLTVDYRNNPNQPNSAVQININADAQLPDAQVEVETVLRITTQIAMETFDSTGAEDFTQMSDERKEELLQKLVEKTVEVMANLSADTLTETAEEVQETAETEPEPEATVVPPAAPPADK